MLKYEEMKEEHLQAVLDIYNYYVLNSTATFHIEPLSLNEMKEIALSKEKRFCSFVIIKDGVIIGYTLLAHYKKRGAYDKTAEITMYLKPGSEGKGVGSEALRFLEEEAKKNDFHTLLGIICGENTASIRMVEKAGYTKCAHYKEVGVKFGRYLDIVSYQKIL
jgi:phosphinothricin acetyltransferase